MFGEGEESRCGPLLPLMSGCVWFLFATHACSGLSSDARASDTRPASDAGVLPSHLHAPT